MEDAEATAVPPPDSARGSSLRSAPNPGSIIGPAVGGFKRSPALTWQVNYLNSTSDHGVDYILLDGSGRINPIWNNHDISRSVFRRFRDKALITGDRNAVIIVAQYLAKFPGDHSSDPKFTHQDVMRQLTREYGFDVGSAVAELEQSRAGDLTEMEKEMAKIIIAGG